MKKMLIAFLVSIFGAAYGAHQIPTTCGICKKTHPRGDRLLAHFPKHAEEGKKPFQCIAENCATDFTRLPRAKDHFRLFHEGQLNPRQHLGADLNVRIIGEGLSDGLTPQQQYDELVIYYGKEARLLVNKTQSISFRKCSQCGRLLKNKKELLNHFVTHTEVKRHFKCTECTSTFVSKKKLDAHFEEAHPSTTPIPEGHLVLNPKAQLSSQEAQDQYDFLRRHFSQLRTEKGGKELKPKGRARKYHETYEEESEEALSESEEALSESEVEPPTTKRWLRSSNSKFSRVFYTEETEETENIIQQEIEPQKDQTILFKGMTAEEIIHLLHDDETPMNDTVFDEFTFEKMVQSNPPVASNFLPHGFTLH